MYISIYRTTRIISSRKGKRKNRLQMDDDVTATNRTTTRWRKKTQEIKEQLRKEADRKIEILSFPLMWISSSNTNALYDSTYAYIYMKKY